ncbi:MAG: hypothetical protein M1484_04810 [Patescibacteria group bacterium]|nr:hypothetical protein [Patescibacteria group bacterium]MCL5432375.1 hypothetical protein [Patescibacteria group bacterium]
MTQLVNWFNHLTSLILTGIIGFLLAFSPAPKHQITAPVVNLENASLSASVNTSGLPSGSSNPVPWGTTESLGNHLYRTYVGNDPAMGTPDEILTALNSYRRDHNVGSVQKDDNLCQLAQWRAQTQNQAGTLDGHKGLEDYMNDPNHWQELNIKAIGENASYGYVLSGVHLIEWVFDSDAEHRANQLNAQWDLACPATSGVTVDIIFGDR